MRVAAAAAPREPSYHFVIRLAWLVVAVVVIGSRVAAQPLEELVLAITAAAWLTWVVARRRLHATATVAALAVLEVASGTLSIWSSVAIGFLVAGGIAAGSGFELRRAVMFAAVGPVLLAVLVVSTHRSTWLALAAAVAALGGLVGGMARRETAERAVQATLLAVESERADLLAERNRIARDVHDVLAHTLGAVAMQLEAAVAVHEEGGARDRLGELLQRSRQLAAEGLTEASRAVRALRDEPLELEPRLEALVAGEAAALEVRGRRRPLAPEAAFALYRAAQESLTNARKHAPGAPARIVLDYRDEATVLTVENGPATAPPGAPTGAGLGLQGMRERLELAGGTLEAHGSAGGWTVEATVPA